LSLLQELRSPWQNRRIIRPVKEALGFLTRETPALADEYLSSRFFQSETYGNRGVNYAWGVGTCILRTHDGVAEMLSPDTYGHAAPEALRPGSIR
jgi:hypothetical protein